MDKSTCYPMQGYDFRLFSIVREEAILKICPNRYYCNSCIELISHPYWFCLNRTLLAPSVAYTLDILSFCIDFSQSSAKLRPGMSEYGHTSQKPAPLLSYSHVEARKAARRKIIDEALQRRTHSPALARGMGFLLLHFSD